MTSIATLIGISVLILILISIALRFKRRWENILMQLEEEKERSARFQKELTDERQKREELLVEWHHSMASLQHQLDYFLGTNNSGEYLTMESPVVRIKGEVRASIFDHPFVDSMARAKTHIAHQIGREIGDHLVRNNLIEYITVAGENGPSLHVAGQTFVNFLPPDQGYKIPHQRYLIK